MPHPKPPEFIEITRKISQDQVVVNKSASYALLLSVWAGKNLGSCDAVSRKSL